MTVRLIARLAVAALAAAMLAGCTAPGAAPEVPAGPERSSTPQATATPAGTVAPVGIAVVGDSNTTGFTGTLEAGLSAGTAWAAQLPPDRFPLAGGWAVDGATTARMLAGVAAFPDGAERVLVMGGTNDLAQGVPTETIEENIRGIVETTGAPAATLLAIAPSDFQPAEALALNADLEALAAREGWNFIDPWTGTRAPDGTWLDAYATDGVHTSPEGYALAGRAVLAHLEGAVQ